MPFTETLPERPTLSDVRDKLLAAGLYLAELRAKPAETRDEVWKADARSAIDFINDYDHVESAMSRGTRPSVGTGPTAATGQIEQFEGRSYGQQFIESEGYRQFHQPGATFHEEELRGSLFINNGDWRNPGMSGAQSRTTIDSTSGLGGVWLPVGQPYDVPPRVQQMRLFLRDVLNVQQTGLPSVPYIQEVNPVSQEFGASAVDPGTQKPEVTMAWIQADAPVRKLAAWVPATEEIIMDAPTLRGYIDSRLAYMLAIREEFEILNGSGTSPHLKGILQYANLQLQAFSADNMTTLGLAVGKVEAVDGEADGMAMHPVDYWRIVTTRQTNKYDGEGFTQGGSVPPYAMPPNQIWGMPVVRSRAIAQLTALVGAYRMGATLFDRLQTTVRVGNQHNDFFTTNKIAILAEERVGLAVHRPDFFVKATLT